jgi:hypothetical protein
MVGLESRPVKSRTAGKQDRDRPAWHSTTLASWKGPILHDMGLFLGGAY